MENKEPNGPLFQNGDLVMTDRGYPMLVIRHWETIVGVRYLMAFIKKDGTEDMRKLKDRRVMHESKLKSKM